MSDKERLIEIFHELDAVQYGEFILASRRKSKYKIFADYVLLNPEGSKLCGKLGLEAINEIELKDGKEYGIAGIISGGAMFAQSIGNYGNRSRILVDYKTRKIKGKIEDKLYLLTEDVGTTAGSIIKTFEFMEEEGILCSKYAIMLVDRQEGARENLEKKGFELHSILTKKDLGII